MAEPVLLGGALPECISFWGAFGEMIMAMRKGIREYPDTVSTWRSGACSRTVASLLHASHPFNMSSRKLF